MENACSISISAPTGSVSTSTPTPTSVSLSRQYAMANSSSASTVTPTPTFHRFSLACTDCDTVNEFEVPTEFDVTECDYECGKCLRDLRCPINQAPSQTFAMYNEPDDVTCVSKYEPTSGASSSVHLESSSCGEKLAPRSDANSEELEAAAADCFIPVVAPLKIGAPKCPPSATKTECESDSTAHDGLLVSTQSRNSSQSTPALSSQLGEKRTLGFDLGERRVDLCASRASRAQDGVDSNSSDECGDFSLDSSSITSTPDSKPDSEVPPQEPVAARLRKRRKSRRPTALADVSADDNPVEEESPKIRGAKARTDSSREQHGPQTVDGASSDVPPVNALSTRRRRGSASIADTSSDGGGSVGVYAYSDVDFSDVDLSSDGATSDASGEEGEIRSHKKKRRKKGVNLVVLHKTDKRLSRKPISEKWKCPDCGNFYTQGSKNAHLCYRLSRGLPPRRSCKHCDVTYLCLPEQHICSDAALERVRKKGGVKWVKPAPYHCPECAKTVSDKYQHVCWRKAHNKPPVGRWFCHDCKRVVWGLESHSCKLEGHDVRRQKRKRRAGFCDQCNKEFKDILAHGCYREKHGLPPLKGKQPWFCKACDKLVSVALNHNCWRLLNGVSPIKRDLRKEYARTKAKNKRKRAKSSSEAPSLEPSGS